MRRSEGIVWANAPDIKKEVIKLIKSSGITWVKVSRVFVKRSTNAKTRASARIWGLPKLWQKVLNVKPAYILEVISEKYDQLSGYEKNKILLHELAHIPKNFSGSLVPHIRHGKRNFYAKVNNLIKKIK